jgi:hypothetical protein
MAATSGRVLKKFRRLHKKLHGSDRVCSFVKFTNAVEDYYTASTTSIETTPIDPQPVVKDQDRPRFMSFEHGAVISESLFGGISADQRIFIVLADSFVPRLPIATLSERCEDFILARTGQDKGGILYGKTVYTIEKMMGNPTIGSVTARYYLLCRAVKKVGS